MADDTAPEPLTPVTEDWQRALCVVAHPDDLEFGAAAAVARWTGQGKTVVYAMVTSGEAGIDAHGARQCRPVREAEQSSRPGSSASTWWSSSASRTASWSTACRYGARSARRSAGTSRRS